MADIFQAYADDLPKRRKSNARALDAWKALREAFGALRPDQVTRERCRLYTASRRARKRKDGTIGKELSVLRAALRWHDKATRAQIELPRRPPPKERHLTRQEYRALRLAAKRTAFHLWLFVVLALATGARKQALLDLTWDRVDFEKGRIRLDAGEEGKGRATVPMSRNARRALRLAYALRSRSGYVIEYGGHELTTIKRGFASAASKAGFNDVTPHTLRHTAAVWMAEAGIPMVEIAQYLGHSDSRLTERVYARFSPDYLSRAARALG